MLVSLPFLYLELLASGKKSPSPCLSLGVGLGYLRQCLQARRECLGCGLDSRGLHYNFCLPDAWPALPECSITAKSTDIALSQAQKPQNLLSTDLAESLKVTSGLRVKQHGINLKTTALIFSSILEKPVWLMLVMTQQNLS